MVSNGKNMRPPRFPGIDWQCDKCGSLLNGQPGFDDHHYVWKCTSCGYKNSISRANIIHDSLLKKFFMNFFELLIAYAEEITFIGFCGAIVAIIISIIKGENISVTVSTVGLNKTISETAVTYMAYSIPTYPIMLIVSFFCQKFLRFYSNAYRNKSIIQIIWTDFVVDLTFPLYIVLRWQKRYKESKIGNFIKKTICFVLVWLMPVLIAVYGIVKTV